MTVESGTTPLPPADAGDLAEQALDLEPDDLERDEVAPEDEPLAPEADPGDVLEQRREIGWDEEHDVTG
jgi:hypothetical protein